MLPLFEADAAAESGFTQHSCRWLAARFGAGRALPRMREPRSVAGALVDGFFAAKLARAVRELERGVAAAARKGRAAAELAELRGSRAAERARAAAEEGGGRGRGGSGKKSVVVMDGVAVTPGLEKVARIVAQEAKNRPNAPVPEKFHRWILMGVRNTSDAL